MHIPILINNRSILNKGLKDVNGRDRGLTLVEVLVATVIGSLVVLAGLALSQSSLQSNLRILTAQKLRDNWSKIALLINADVSESCSAAGTASSLSLRVLAAPEGSGLTCSTNGVEIRYSLSGTTLTRSGPPARRNGALALVGSSGSVFLTSRSEIISNSVSTFNATGTTAYTPRFTLTLSDQGLSYSGDNSSSLGSRSRVRSFD